MSPGSSPKCVRSWVNLAPGITRFEVGIFHCCPSLARNKFFPFVRALKLGSIGEVSFVGILQECAL